MFAVKKRTLTIVAIIVAAVGFVMPIRSSFAALYGFYLIKNVRNGACLRAANIGANAEVYFAFACNPGDRNQNWYVAEVSRTSAGYGRNIIYLADDYARAWCISSRNALQSRLVLEQCDIYSQFHIWITDEPKNYGSPYGDSYRLHWDRNHNFCGDNGGVSQQPYVYTCLAESDPNRPNQQWYFIKNW